MRCHDIRDRIDSLWEGMPGDEIIRHLQECAECSVYFRDLRLVRSGFRLMKGEEPVAPSLGFTERLVRRLSEAAGTPRVGEFFERVGRRFVYAAFALTALVVLGLTLPSTGPVRGPASSDYLITSQEASLAYSDPMGEIIQPESPERAPNAVKMPAVTHEAK